MFAPGIKATRFSCFRTPAADQDYAPQIRTDPVSGATSTLGRLIFGAGVGVLAYVIRAWGGYPDGVAFAVLLMNLAAPTIDYFTRPRTYGHSKPERGFKLGD